MDERLKAGYDMGKKFCDRHGFSGDNALDIGAGHCAHTVGFAEKFNRVLALDRTEERYDPQELLKLSPAAKKVDFIEADAHDIGSLGERFDLVYSLSAMEHMYDWRKIMKTIPKIINKWFYLVISPLYYSPLGHHLDPEIGEWEHLLLPGHELWQKCQDLGVEDRRWQIYKELNKVTVAELVEEAQKDMKITYLKADITTIEMVCEKRT